MKKLSSYLKVRAVKLGILAVFLFTFAGLPALGQMAGTNTFQGLDVVQGTANLLSYYDMNGMWVDDGAYYDPNMGGGGDPYMDGSYYDPNMGGGTDYYDPYYQEPVALTCSSLGGQFCSSGQTCNSWIDYSASDGECCMGSCEANQCATDDNGTAIYGGDTMYYSDGGWTKYTIDCLVEDSYAPPVETYTDTTYDNGNYNDDYYYDGSYDSYDSGSEWTASSCASDDCSWVEDSYGGWCDCAGGSYDYDDDYYHYDNDYSDSECCGPSACYGDGCSGSNDPYDCGPNANEPCCSYTSGYSAPSSCNSYDDYHYNYDNDDDDYYNNDYYYDDDNYVDPYDEYGYDADFCDGGCWADYNSDGSFSHCECPAGECPDTCSANYTSSGNFDYCSCPWDSENWSDNSYDDYDDYDNYDNWDDDDWDDYYGESCGFQDYWGAEMYAYGWMCTEDDKAQDIDGNCELIGEPYHDEWKCGTGNNNDYHYDENGAVGPGMGFDWEAEWDQYNYYSNDDVCTIDFYGAWIYPYGKAYINENLDWIIPGKNCETIEEGTDYMDYSTWEYDPMMDTKNDWGHNDDYYMNEYDDHYKEDMGYYEYDFGGKEIHMDYGWGMEYVDEFADKYDYSNDYGFQDKGHYDYNDWDMGWGEFDQVDDWSDTISSTEARSQQNDLARRLGDFEDIGRELDRMTKRLERSQENNADHSEDLQREISRLSSFGKDTDGIEDELDGIAVTLTALQEDMAEVEFVKSFYESDYSDMGNLVDDLGSGDTWADFGAADLNVNKMDSYWHLITVLNARVDHTERMGELGDLKSQIAMAKKELAENDIDVPKDMEDEIEDLKGEMAELEAYGPELDSLYNDLNLVTAEKRAATDWETIDDLQWEEQYIADDAMWLADEMRQDMDHFFRNEPWRIVGNLMDQAHNMGKATDMLSEITMIRTEIAQATDVITIMTDLDLDSRTEKAVTNLGELAGVALGAIDKMTDMLNDEVHLDDPEIIPMFWDQMDQVEASFEKNIHVATDWLEDNLDDLEDELSSSELATLEEMLEWDDHGDGPDYEEFAENYNFDTDYRYQRYDAYDNDLAYFESLGDIGNAYATMTFDTNLNFNIEEIVAQMTAQIVEDFTRKINELVAEKVFELYSAGIPSIEKVTNNIDLYDEVLVEATADVQELIAELDDNNDEIADLIDSHIDENPDLEDEFDKNKELREEMEEILIATDSKEDMQEAWEEVRVLITSEEAPEEAEMQEQNEIIEDLLKENQDNLVFVENAEFFDVGFAENPWYYEPVISALDENIVNGYKDASGELTGYYEPGNNVTMAEALKMTIEASGTDVANAASGEAWYAPYVDAGQDIGLSNVNDNIDWGAQATRGDVAIWTSEAFELEGDDYDYDGAFPDVSSSDSNAGHYQAVYEAGIFTGDDGTGYLRPNEPVNRAETAAIVTRGVKNTQTNTVDNLTDFMESDEYSMYGPTDGEWTIFAKVVDSMKNVFSSVFGY
jgi:hypothetical protein